MASVLSPNIDRLAAQGALLTRAFSTSCGCSPSRASIATGRYPHANGVMGLAHPPFNWSLGPEERHMASILAEHGYETALFGFQHVATDESTLGFERLFTRGTALAADLCPRVEQYLSSRDRARPLYIEVNLEEPHRPFSQGGARPDRSRGVTVPAYLPAGGASERELAGLQGAIRQADVGIGRILESLSRAGMGDHAMVVFLADHGLALPRAKGTLYDPGIEVACAFRWPGRIAAGSRVAEPVSHVDILPTVLEAAGIDSPANLHGVSVLSLLLGRDGGVSRPAIQGHRERQDSMDAGATDGSPFSIPRPCVAAGVTELRVERSAIFAEKTYHSYYDPIRAIRTKTHKLIVNFESTFAVEVPGDVQAGAIFRLDPDRYHGTQHSMVELYDLQSDPLEETNLAGQVELGVLEADLRRRLREWMEETGDPLLRGPITSPTHQDAGAWLRG